MSTNINTKLLRAQRDSLLSVIDHIESNGYFSKTEVTHLNGIIFLLDHLLDVNEGHNKNEQEGIAWLSNELTKTKHQANAMRDCLKTLSGTLEYYVAFGRDLPLSDLTMILEMVNSVPAMQETKKEQEDNNTKTT